MGVQVQYAADKNTVTIKISGKFDFNMVQDFRHAYRDLDKPKASYTIDMRETEYMDSSALGMLLHLWKFAGEDPNRIEIVNCSPGIRKIFDITHFGKKFRIR